MDWSGPGFVLTIIGMSMAAWVANTFIRARHGYPVENELGGLTAREDGLATPRQLELLGTENAALRAQVTRLEERIAVLDRIVTDPGRRVADEIEALR